MPACDDDGDTREQSGHFVILAIADITDDVDYLRYFIYLPSYSILPPPRDARDSGFLRRSREL